MSLYQGLAALRAKLLGRRGAPSPAEAWVARREKAYPDDVIREHFRAMAAHDLDWILATLSPERAMLYNDSRTVDRRRLTVHEANVLSVAETQADVPLPVFADRYRSHLVLKVEYELHLVDPEQQRDPTLREGRDWAYYVLVTQARGNPWMIADWGR